MNLLCKRALFWMGVLFYVVKCLSTLNVRR
nr:MAG TPA: hypothetical protein [Caudoviricetes sp.]